MDILLAFLDQNYVFCFSSHLICQTATIAANQRTICNEDKGSVSPDHSLIFLVIILLFYLLLLPRMPIPESTFIAEKQTFYPFLGAINVIAEEQTLYPFLAAILPNDTEYIEYEMPLMIKTWARTSRFPVQSVLSKINIHTAFCDRNARNTSFPLQ